MKQTFPATLGMFIMAISLAACGGGGSSSPSSPATAAPTTAPTATPKPSPTPTAAPAMATATGTVVDFTANTPLAGVKVAIAPNTKGAAATQVATTDANGHFSFTKAPGAYFLVIGSDSAADMTTTLHKQIMLVAGVNALSLPIPTAPANVTLRAAQLSGNFRLTALNSTELNCVSGAEAGRTAVNLPTMVPDEFLTENAVALAVEGEAQGTDTPTPMFLSGAWTFYAALGAPNTVGVADESTAEGATPCSEWTGPLSFTSGNVQYPLATNASYIYYGADNEGAAAPGNVLPIGAQVWASDPRN